MNITISDAYPVTVDSTLSLEDMITAGHYDLVDKTIMWQDFLISTETYNVDVVLVNFGRPMTISRVAFNLKKLGLRPAKIEELLAFGAKYPDVQREFHLSALGSSLLIGGPWEVPYLTSNGTWRVLGLNEGNHHVYKMARDCQFLAVRNTGTPT